MKSKARTAAPKASSDADAPAVPDPVPEGASVPEGVREIAAPWPLEISGVAAVPGGYAVVGDEDPKHGRFWPSGGRFALPGKLKGPESIAVGYGPDAAELWLLLGEKKGRIVDGVGGSYTLGKSFAEEDGRGAEGLAVRWHEERWQVAVAWEGGYYDAEGGKGGIFALPRVALLTWEPGAKPGGKKHRHRLERVFDLQVPLPSQNERFRVPDLIWDGDGILALLVSTDASREVRSHVWIQRFDLDGQPDRAPLKLEERWGAYCAGRNWEALDRTLDGAGLVLGFDEKDPDTRRVLVVFPYP